MLRSVVVSGLTAYHVELVVRVTPASTKDHPVPA